MGAMGVAVASRYTLKADPYSSHTVILDWLAEGHGRRLLDVGAADGLLSRHLTERGWRVTGLEADPDAAQAGAGSCDRMIVADLNQDLPDVDGPFDAIVYGDVLEHLIDPGRVLMMLLIMLVVPVATGMLIRARWSQTADTIRLWSRRTHSRQASDALATTRDSLAGRTGGVSKMT